MSDTKELTLPISKSKVIIRAYTTRADDALADEVLYDNVYSDGLGEIKMPGINGLRKRHLYVERLTESIDDISENVVTRLKDLRTPDYEYLEEEVSKVVESNSPKAKRA